MRVPCVESLCKKFSKIGHQHSTEYARIDHAHEELPTEPSALVGEVRMWAGFSGVPDGWEACGGQALSRETYADLFGVIGTQFGNGDGSTTFNIPNFCYRFPLGVSPDPPVVGLGWEGGESEHTLTMQEMPSHRHKITQSTSNSLGGSSYGFPGLTGQFNNLYTDYEGGGGEHNNMPPYLGIYFIIYAGA